MKILSVSRAALAIGFALFSVGDIAAQPSKAPAAASPGGQAQNYTFAFQDADLTAVAEEVLGQTLGLSYTIDAGVSAKVSFRLDQRLTRTQLLDAFEGALATRDIMLVRDGERLLITTRAKAKGSAVAVGTGSRGGYQRLSIPILSSTPAEVAKGLQSLGMADLIVLADDNGGTIMLAGTARELAAAQDAIRTLDRNASASNRNRMIELHNAGATEVAHDLAEVIRSNGLSGVTVSPVDRLNSLLVFARNEQSLDQIQSWVNRLDVVAKREQSSLWAYKPKNVSAESLSVTLNDVMVGQGPDGPARPTPQPSSPARSTTGFSTGSSTGSAAPSRTTTTAPAPISNRPTTDADIRFAVDRDSNTLLISAPPAKRPEIERLLVEIDVLPRQVLIEASIIEVSLSNDFRFGVNWSFLSRNGNVQVVQSNNQAGQVAPTLPGLAITYLSNNVDAAVDALRSKTAIRVLSAPKLVALDNQAARLQIGDQVPVATQTQQSTASSDAPRLVSIDYRNTGVILEVTPRITGEDGVTLSVAQEVSTVARTTTSGIDSPTIRQRRFDSVLLLKSGGTVALGGLISSSDQRGNTGVPELEKTPILGNLFKSQSRDRDRTELIVLLSAKILPDAAASAAAAKIMSTEMQSIGDHGFKAP